MKSVLHLYVFIIILYNAAAQKSRKSERLSKLERDVRELKAQLNICCRGSGSNGGSNAGNGNGEQPFVAFTAAGIGAQLLKTGTKIEFAKVLTNWGLAYNRHTSEFICPHSGVYLFTYSINSYFLMRDSSFMRLRSQASLIVDNNLIVDILNFNDNSNNYLITTGTNSAVTFCRKGGKVFVRSEFDNNAVWSFAMHPRTTFTGILLRTSQRNDFPTQNDPRSGEGGEELLDGDLEAL